LAKYLYLIDGFAQVFRAYYAIRGGMQSPVTGEPTHAVFGFTGMLIKLFSQLKPDYVVVAIDGPGKTFRDELYADYKATRDETPQDLLAQIPRVLELIEAFGVPAISHPGLEADDIIATITQRVLDDPNLKDVRIRIVSRDKDLEQLLCDRVTMYDIHKDEEIDVAKLKELKGITPEQVVDVLALMGDAVDNVPGVPGIGPKTAASLVQEFGSIEGILANLDKIKGKRRENLEAAKDQLPLSRALVTLKRDGDFPFNLDDAQVKGIDLSKIIPLFQQLGFRRYQHEVRKLALELGLVRGDSALALQEEEGIAAAVDGSLAREGAAPAPMPLPLEGLAGGEPKRGRYELILDRAQLEELVETLRKQELIAVDTETTGLDTNAGLCGLSFAWEPGHGVYVPTLSREKERHLDTETVLSALKEVLEDPAIKKCGHNIKFDARILANAGVKLRGVVFDSMLASILLDPAKPGHKLEQLALDLLGYVMIPISDLIGSGDGSISMAEVPLEKVGPYAAEDADISLRLYHRLLPQIRAAGMEELLTRVEAPLAVVLAEMERNGITCDPEELMRQGEELSRRVEKLRARIYEYAGCEFNLDSPKQLGEVLFEKLGLPAGKRTKTGYSTDIEVLTNLAAEEDPSDPKTLVPGLLIEYRQLAKLINTYLGNLRDAIDPKTGRIHSTFHQLVTATGRLASQNPNLQNIPVRTDVGRQIRKAFVAPPGHVLICADYSQIELRILAHFSEDPGLIEAFEKGLDIHAAVASQVFGVAIDEVTREQRAHAKTINFGIIYGITPYGLARRIEGLDVTRAAELIADYKRRFPGIDRFLNECVQHALDHGYVTTILGRRRAIPEIRSNNRARRALGERLAINSVVQGSAADLIKVAMVNLQERIDREQIPLKLLLQIHDELVFECPAEEGEALAHVVVEEMERAMSLKVPLKAEAGIGEDWMTAK
jgi:DNA polymerase I